VYQDVFRPAVEQMAQGFNVTLFAYGQTGSGKTHTMTGDARDPGITTMAFAQIFDNVKKSRNMAYNISVSVMEIYQDVMFDLLNRRAKVGIKGSGVQLRFANLTESAVHSAEEAFRVVAAGMRERTITATYRHERSNRSHCIVRVTQESQDDEDTELQHVLTSSLLLVDLAGSETVSEHHESKSAKEGKAIVKSLFFLRRCIHALSAGQRPDFRSSNLTRLLEPSLIHGCVSIICNTSHCVTNLRQVVDCLEFGKQAQVVMLDPRQNVAEGDTEFHKLRALLRAAEDEKADLASELELLREQRAQQIQEVQSKMVSSSSMTVLEEQLRRETREKTGAMEKLAAAEAENKSLEAKLREMADLAKEALSLTWDVQGVNGSVPPQQPSVVTAELQARLAAAKQHAEQLARRSSPENVALQQLVAETKAAFRKGQACEAAGDLQGALVVYQEGVRSTMGSLEGAPQVRRYPAHSNWRLRERGLSGR
jgi:hypothetical protein